MAGTTRALLAKSVTRREEMAARARRRREANRERKKRLERRRQKEAEVTRMKHEGPSVAELVRAVVAKRIQRLKTCAKDSNNAKISSLHLACCSLLSPAVGSHEFMVPCCTGSVL